jgi:hypothetical protein
MVQAQDADGHLGDGVKNEQGRAVSHDNEAGV